MRRRRADGPDRLLLLRQLREETYGDVRYRNAPAMESAAAGDAFEKAELGREDVHGGQYEGNVQRVQKGRGRVVRHNLLVGAS